MRSKAVHAMQGYGAPAIQVGWQHRRSVRAHERTQAKHTRTCPVPHQPQKRSMFAIHNACLVHHHLTYCAAEHAGK